MRDPIVREKARHHASEWASTASDLRKQANKEQIQGNHAAAKELYKQAKYCDNICDEFAKLAAAIRCAR
jgi:hypothetical protein